MLDAFGSPSFYPLGLFFSFISLMAMALGFLLFPGYSGTASRVLAVKERGASGGRAYWTQRRTYGALVYQMSSWWFWR